MTVSLEVPARGRYLRKDGSRFFASGVSTPIRDEDGKLVGFAKVCRDITDQKRAELEREPLLKEVQPERLRITKCAAIPREGGR